MVGWTSNQTTHTVFTSAVRLFRLLIVHVFAGEALSIFSKNFSFAFTAWLNVWDKRPSFWSVTAFEMSSSLNIIVSSFCFSDSSFHLTLRGHCRVIDWPDFNIIVSQGTGRPEEMGRRRGTTSQWGSQDTDNIYQ